MDKELVGGDRQQISPNKKASIIIGVFSCFFVILFGNWEYPFTLPIIKSIAYTAIVEFVILFYMNVHRKRIFVKAYAWWVVDIGFLISFCLLLNKSSISDYPLWMLGGILIASLIDMYLGILITYSLLLLSIIINLLSLKIAIMHLIVGSILFFCIKYLNKISNTIYICVILLSISLTLILIKNNFVLWNIKSVHTVFFISSSMIVAIVTFLIRVLFARAFWKEKNVAHDFKEKHNQQTLSYDKILEITDESFPLLVRLQNEAPKLYQHSMLAAKLSKKAAMSIKANEHLAFTGALYHEIGRLEGNDYITLGLNLLNQYRIPNEIKEIVQQHSYKSELPTTKEAAIVLLTDNIITTVEYLRNTGHTNISYDKLIDTIFLMRFKNKTLDRSGISLQEYNTLKEFYISEFALS